MSPTGRFGVTYRIDRHSHTARRPSPRTGRVPTPIPYGAHTYVPVRRGRCIRGVTHVIQIRAGALAENDIHDVLSNSRRRTAIRELRTSGGWITVRELSEAIATDETGQSPAPRCTRESVYASLHQTHLPRLHDLGVVEYDRTTKRVRACSGARDVGRYMTVVTGYGLTWAELYQALGVVTLLVVLAALLEVPVIAAVDPILWTSLALATFAGVTVIHLWKAARLPLSRSLRP